jgi:hypothetical protein
MDGRDADDDERVCGDERVDGRSIGGGAERGAGERDFVYVCGVAGRTRAVGTVFAE